MCHQQRLRSACAYAQPDQSLCQSFEFSRDVKLLTEFYLEFLSLQVGYTGSSESTLVIMLHCWKSHVTAQLKLLKAYFKLQGFAGWSVPLLFACNRVKFSRVEGYVCANSEKFFHTVKMCSSSESLLVTYSINTKTLCAGSIVLYLG